MKRSHTGSYSLLPLAGTFAVLILMVAFSFISLLVYRSNLNKTLSEITRRDLERYNNQSVMLFNNIVQKAFLQLDMVSKFSVVNSGKNDHEIIEVLRQGNINTDQMRFGISGRDGILYTGNGRPIDISDQAYFRNAMRGERGISDVVKNGYNGRDVIIFAVPVKVKDRVMGAIFVQYDVQYFTDLLGDSQFKGRGATMVIQKDGRMVSSYAGMENFETFYDALKLMDFYGEDTLDSLKAHIKDGDSGFFTYYRNGKARYLYYGPTGIRDYTMLSLVLAESMDQDFNEISRQTMLLTLKSIFSYTMILVCIWMFFFQIRRMVRYFQNDPLTQTYNKISAQKAISRYLMGQGRRGTHALLFLDVDNFKAINDCYGHDTGDQLLMGLGQTLKGRFRSIDIVGRFGGDEFLVFMKNIPSALVAEEKARLLCEMFTRDWEMYALSVSIGIACYPENGTTYRELLEHADKALYQAKKHGKNQYNLYGSGAQEPGA